MRLNPYVYGVLVLLIFLGTIGAAQAGGWWSVSGKVNATGQRITATGANVDEIKGWMTLEEISRAYNVSHEEILAAFGLPDATPPTRQVKELESATFSVTGLRAWLKTRSGQ